MNDVEKRMLIIVEQAGFNKLIRKRFHVMWKRLARTFLTPPKRLFHRVTKATVYRVGMQSVKLNTTLLRCVMKHNLILAATALLTRLDRKWRD